MKNKGGRPPGEPGRVPHTCGFKVKPVRGIWSVAAACDVFLRDRKLIGEHEGTFEYANGARLGKEEFLKRKAAKGE